MKNKKYLVLLFLVFLAISTTKSAKAAAECGTVAYRGDVGNFDAYAFAGSPPTAMFCASGNIINPSVYQSKTPKPEKNPNDASEWMWTCKEGTGNSSTLSTCYSPTSATATNIDHALDGKCGPWNGLVFDSRPTTYSFDKIKLCEKGTYSGLNGPANGPWTWICSGSVSPKGFYGITAYCSTAAKIDNACAATTCNTTSCWNNLAWVQGAMVCVDNSCADDICTTETCWDDNYEDYIPGKIVCIDNGCAANTCNTTTCWNKLTWVTGTKVCAANTCAANTCTTATCWNGVNWIYGAKNCAVDNECADSTCTTDTCFNGIETVAGNQLCAVDNGCAATTCDTTTCFNGISTVNGVKSCVVDNGCAAATCNTTTCWNNLAWIQGEMVCADNSCAATICDNATCWNNLAWIAGTKPPTFSSYACSYSNTVDCSKPENCEKTNNITPTNCLAVNSCTGFTVDRLQSECSSICSASTTTCPACPLVTSEWKEL